MSEKPSYLSLLNAISVAEGDAECYLTAWAEATPNAAVAQVLTTVALREGEHSKAFAKRMCELGYSVQPRESDSGSKMAIAMSRDLSDKEKFEKLGVGKPQDDADDVFTRMFADKNIDIQTGALLGRYIAEERDSGRMLYDCYTAVCAEESNGSSAVTDGLTAQLGRNEELLTKLLTPAKAKK
jgi:hypothetical protein